MTEDGRGTEHANQERELKLVPADDALLDRLANVEQLGPFRAKSRGHEAQHNAFFDSAARSLEQAKIGFRRRTIEGQSLARWTIKGDAERLGGVSTRDEIEISLAADTPPALAISTLHEAAAQRGAGALAEALADALRIGGPPLAEPFLETATDRRTVDLVDGDREVELALDRMRIIGHDYAETEIEAELKHGDAAALDEVRGAIEAIGDVRESEGSKLSRAVEHVRDCDCRRQR